MSPSSCKPHWSVVVNAKIHWPIPSGAGASRVAAMFGLDEGHSEELYGNFELTMGSGQIVAVVGPSGAGKTVLLREVARQVRGAVRLRVDELARSALPAVEVLKGGALQERLEVLSRCGLAEALALITPARCLSGGQLHRLAIAEALFTARGGSGPRLVIADEFAAMLDHETAAVLCRQVRKLITNSAICLLAATPRVELLECLQPDQLISKPLGERAGVSDGKFEIGKRNFEIASRPPESWRIVRAAMADYESLGRFHYLAGPPAAHKRVYAIRAPWAVRGGAVRLGLPDVAAVLVVSPPLVNVRGRNIATHGRYTGPDRASAISLLNAEIECISRVIVHPVYRGCGLAVRLVRHALATAETPMVEALAAMGAVHPFFERAGMKAYRLERDRHSARLISAAEAVGLGAEELAAVAPVKMFLRRRSSAAAFLRDELRLCIKRTVLPQRLRRLADPMAEVCRRTARQYVYYLAHRTPACLPGGRRIGRKESKSCRKNRTPRRRLAKSL